ncbi:hypothetical protein [Anaerocolumna chitinilytica]|uniref:Tyr recombinase domain-containing protein n=1 Tax=Anaerocolumna chitinilytica TaxID=1727145 RepID=A0A7I8DWR6_9FIRM|nr:hypothetical protein [Anaerocolumna chitinilytica]BCK00737.1 hypothetical protein bsdcttw_37770 [Anaerocolumna chitinilytica]
MARNREKHESLVHQVEMKLKSKLAIGQSRNDDKMADKLKRKKKKKTGSKEKLAYDESITMHKIYTWNTFKDYLKHACYFAKWCKEHYGCRTLSECMQYVDEWLTTRLTLSPYTQKLEACALAKVYDCTTEDFIKTGVRHRESITKSRKTAKRDKNFSATKNKEFIEFCKATGLRKRELKCLTGTQLMMKNGLYYIAVTKGAKGGKYREALIVSNVDAVVKRMMEAGTSKVWSYVPDMDVHSFRSDYCTELYNLFARPLEKIQKSERYHCRCDLKGVCYDKRAMLIASQFLGHNRINIIAEHYLR